jgi:hypothetical protein
MLTNNFISVHPRAGQLLIICVDVKHKNYSGAQLWIALDIFVLFFVLLGKEA